ncbi:hypothetical protein D2E70_25040 [Mycobacteroides abscessus]|uniref:hypothetical protein n=1 Tax=Mycobacteroides abscessus TaxID=36809 RepID=UPI000E696AB2|nr:hypothetical protein [Mycobacteroides abscessus]RIS64142.1 hypothetical protein D2E70_25040 [Mycobacteroides abscessus]
MNIHIAASAATAGAGVGVGAVIIFIAAQLLADRKWFQKLAANCASGESPSLLSAGRSTVEQPAQQDRESRADRNDDNEGIYLAGRTRTAQEGNR